MSCGSKTPQELLEIVLQADREIAAVEPQDTFGLYEAVHKTAERLVQTDAFYVCLYQDHDETLYFPFNFDSGRFDPPQWHKMGHGPTSWVIRNNEPLLLQDENQHIHHAGVNFGHTQRASLSAIHVPLHKVVRDGNVEVAGAISVQSYKPNAYSTECVPLIQWLGDRAGMVLAYQQREQELRDQLADLGHRLEHETFERHHQSQSMIMDFIARMENVQELVEQIIERLTSGKSSLAGPLARLRTLIYRHLTEVSQQPGKESAVTSGGNDHTHPHPLPNLKALTARERDILKLMVEGHGNQSMAQTLHISVDTVKFHCKNIYRKLNATNRVHAVQVFLMAGGLNNDPTLSGR